MNGYDTVEKLGCSCGCGNNGMSGLAGFPDSAIGKYGRSSKPIIYYVSMGGEAAKTRSLNSYGYAFHGKIKAFNSSKTWAQVYDPGTGKNYWIPFVSNPDLVWAVNFDQNGNPRAASTPEELRRAREMGAEAVVNQTPYGYVANVAVDVAEGVGETLQSGLDMVGFLGRNLKWILIGGGVLVAAYYVVPVVKQFTKK